MFNIIIYHIIMYDIIYIIIIQSLLTENFFIYLIDYFSISHTYIFNFTFYITQF